MHGFISDSLLPSCRDLGDADTRSTGLHLAATSQWSSPTFCCSSKEENRDSFKKLPHRTAASTALQRQCFALLKVLLVFTHPLSNKIVNVACGLWNSHQIVRLKWKVFFSLFSFVPLIKTRGRHYVDSFKKYSLNNVFYFNKLISTDSQSKQLNCQNHAMSHTLKSARCKHVAWELSFVQIQNSTICFSRIHLKELIHLSAALVKLFFF